MWQEVQDRINKSMSKARNALFGKISSVLKDDNEVYMKFTDEDEIRDIVNITPYGLYSLPNEGMLGQIIFNNSQKKAALIGVEDRTGKPIQIEVGEVLFYNSNGKNYIHLKNDGKIYIKGTEIHLNEEG